MNDQFKNLSENVNLIFNIFTRFNYKIYLVGGCVRDLLLGITPHDYDFTTDATPDQMLEIAKKSNITVIPTGIQYGTVTFRIDNESFEITTYRKDSNYEILEKNDN